MEDKRMQSWPDIFIKIILVVIFVLFTIWLLSLATKGTTNSLEVLTDNIFSENIEKMKEVGKDYFTTERLPEKVGDVKKITLERMYKKKLITKLYDKNGVSCSAKNSYVSIEKYENEYQMKVYLECGEENDYIIVILGCYDYCDTDICELDEKKDETSKEETTIPDNPKGEITQPDNSKDEPTNNNKKIEYQYKKYIRGRWSDWGNWSDWTKTPINQEVDVDVETKVVTEKYTYDKNGNKTIYTEPKTCPTTYNGYKLVSQNGFTCNYSKDVTTTVEPKTCPSTYNGYTLVRQNGFTCEYSKDSTTTVEPNVCPSTYNGYTLVSQNGFTCNYSKDVTTTVEPKACPSTYNGYTLVSQNGFTCNYSKDVTTTVEPKACPSTYNGYTLVSQNGFTCNYSKTTTTTSEKQEFTLINKDVIFDSRPIDTDMYHYENIRTFLDTCQEDKENKDTENCVKKLKYKADVYLIEYKTETKTNEETTTTTTSCPTGYNQSGTKCIKTEKANTTTTTSCPTGYNQSGTKCIKNDSKLITTTTSCPTGYNKSGTKCMKNDSKLITTTTSCPTGYNQSGTKCVKNDSKLITTTTSCPTGYNKTSDNLRCYKVISKTESSTETVNVTYYRYRVRNYILGTTDYKWSFSNNDKNLLNAGYTLTGKTR